MSSITTLECSYIVKLPEGWRQHRLAYQVIISRARRAFIIAPAGTGSGG